MTGRARLTLSAVAGLVIAIATSWYQRIGPAPPEWDQELCSYHPPRSCRDGVLQGGWPLAYIVDSPGVSVVGKVTIVGEDHFHPLPFAVDAALAGALVWLLLGLRGNGRSGLPVRS